MSARAIATVAGVVLVACAAPSRALAECPTDVDRAQLTLNYNDFDGAGWRELLARGCTDAAVAQVLAYRDANGGRLNDDQVRELNFHAGQALAMSGREAEGVAYFEQARGGSEEWDSYVEATLAFLKRDSASLAVQRSRYAAAPGTSAMRLQFIDGFVACPDRSYMEAAHCGMHG